MNKKIAIDIDAIDAKVLDRLDQLAAKLNNVGAAMGNVRQASQRVATGSSVGGGRGRVSAPPMQIQSQAQAAQVMAFARAQIAANPNNQAAYRLYNQANRKYNQLDPMKMLYQAMMRTRFSAGSPGGGLVGNMLGIDIMKLANAGMGGHAAQMMGFGGGGGAKGIASLVGNLASMAAEIPGLNVALAGLAIAAGGAVLAIMAMDQRMKELVGNGTVTAAGGSYGGASAFKGNLSGVQAIYAMRAGINPIGGPFGDNDYGAKQVKALKFIAGAGNNIGEARRRAEGLGIPDAAEFSLVSPETQKRMLRTMNPSLNEMKAIAEFNAQLAIGAAELRMILARGFTPFLKALNGAASILWKWVDAVREMVNWIRGKLGLPAIPKEDAPQTDNTKALEDNTRAVNANTKTIQGGDARARSAGGGRINGHEIDVRQWAGRVRFSTAF